MRLLKQENLELKHNLETQRKDTEEKLKEVEKREAQIISDQQKLVTEKTQVNISTSYLHTKNLNSLPKFSLNIIDKSFRQSHCMSHNTDGSSKCMWRWLLLVLPG